MKKFEFSLRHMRDYRERLLDEEKGTLQRRKAERDQIENDIARLEGDFAALSRKMQEKAEKGTTVIELRKLSAQMDNVRLQIQDLEKALVKAEQRVEKQMDVVVEANKEVTKLDKLEEKQREEYRHQVSKAEEDRILGAAQKPAAPAAGSIFCTSCGKALAAGSRFCDGCGAPVT